MVRNKTYSELTRWELRWMGAAAENANMSKDPSTKCGTVIIDPSGKRRISEGYNGLPQRLPDTKETLNKHRYKVDREFTINDNLIKQLNKESDQTL